MFKVKFRIFMLGSLVAAARAFAWTNLPLSKTCLPHTPLRGIAGPYSAGFNQNQQSRKGDRRNTACFVSAPNQEGKKTLVEQDVVVDFVTITAPSFLAAVAFVTYEDVSKAFHNFVDNASGHTWAPVDGGAYLTELITPALNGPVSSFISLLFGTLASMTVGSLYARQNTLVRELGNLLEDVRLMEIHIQYFPDGYRERFQQQLDVYAAILLKNVRQQQSREDLRKSRERGRIILENMMTGLHDMSDDPNAKLRPSVLDESYGTLNRLIQTRGRLVSSFESFFPIWHYGSLSVLAMAICFIFLALTDKTALLFLGGFQLRVCWAMLIGTFSLLASVIYDLNSPLSGAYQIVKPIGMSGFDVDKYVAMLNAKGDLELDGLKADVPVPSTEK